MGYLSNACRSCTGAYHSPWHYCHEWKINNEGVKFCDVEDDRDGGGRGDNREGKEGSKEERRGWGVKTGNMEGEKKTEL